jgi:hypothetical protein
MAVKPIRMIGSIENCYWWMGKKYNTHARDGEGPYIYD